MSRSERLLALLQSLRAHRQPVAGRQLAADLGISLRTLYRDIASLQAQGAMIEGEAGLGYVLKPGFTLPPLMFSVEEIEALVLGSRWVARRGDAQLGMAAASALVKIAAVLPAALQEDLEASALLVGPGTPQPAESADAAVIRDAIRREHKLAITYADGNGGITQRRIWPFALAFFEEVRVVVAWCELRDDFRSFRTDRIAALAVTPERYPRRRQALLKAWRQEQMTAAPKAADGN